MNPDGTGQRLLVNLPRGATFLKFVTTAIIFAFKA